MSALIEEFKKEHSEIIAILKEVKKLGIHSEEGRSKLMSAKEYLLEHLHKDNEQLDPVLIEIIDRISQLSGATFPWE